ncbi:hypothetical protein M5D96_004847 [Drosophila gunungcola]|uniref:Epidermal growth factor receptor n=1 Tax=Drosophila gunungcola TaxID=103775 RepID=A0A9P9YV88_9MUSC|nr:hypothetical protein M5D96_004847 [Drosophila gunungcola]
MWLLLLFCPPAAAPPSSALVHPDSCTRSGSQMRSMYSDPDPKSGIRNSSGYRSSCVQRPSVVSV